MMQLEDLRWLVSITPHPSTSLTCAILLSTALLATISLSLSRRSKTRKPEEHALGSKQSSESASTQDNDVRTGRKFADWNAVKFVYPQFPPYGVKVKGIPPRPYRPFRWGNYQSVTTMGIRRMDWAEWIEVDNLLPKYHAIRVDRLRTRKEKVVKILPPRTGVAGAGPAAKEFVYELSEYLTRRYPDTYSVVRHPARHDDFGWYGDGQIKEIRIRPLDVSYDLDNEDAMTVASLLTQDDYAIMIEGADGKYYFQGGAILVAGFWRMEDKLGMPLEEIHTSGLVPQYREKLETSLGRFFLKLPVDKPVQRNNYFFQIIRPCNDSRRDSSIDPDELAWSDTTNGDEDTFEQSTKEPSTMSQDTNSTPKPVESVENIRLRSERQTLRRLPRTGAIIFTIRTYISPIVDLAKEPGVPGRMASAIRSWPDDVARYKGQRLYKDVILPYLDEMHGEQVRLAVIGSDDRTTDYPF